MKKRRVVNYLWLAGLTLVDIYSQRYFRELGWGLDNRGVSLGLMDTWGSEAARVIFLVFLIYFLADKKVRARSSLRWLFFGGLGNFLARAWWGSVVDYLTLPFLPFWFNLSDLMITVGVGSYILGFDEDRGDLRGQGDGDHQQTGRFGGESGRVD